MRWRDMRGSDNLEDREGAGPPGRGLGGGVKLGGVGLIAVARIVWRRLQVPENGCSPSPAATTAVTVDSRRDSY